MFQIGASELIVFAPCDKEVDIFERHNQESARPLLRLNSVSELIIKIKSLTSNTARHKFELKMSTHTKVNLIVLQPVKTTSQNESKIGSISGSFDKGKQTHSDCTLGPHRNVLVYKQMQP